MGMTGESICARVGSRNVKAGKTKRRNEPEEGTKARQQTTQPITCNCAVAKGQDEVNNALRMNPFVRTRSLNPFAEPVH